MDERWDEMAVAGGVWGEGRGDRLFCKQAQVQLHTEPVSPTELDSPNGRPLIREPFAVITSPSRRTAP